MAEKQEDSWTSDDEYAVQYFGFLPQSLLNGMYNGMWEYLKEAMSALNDGILTVFGDKVSETELKEVSHKQGKIALDRLNEKFDKAELYLNDNVFNIPAHIVLPEDRQNIENPCTEEEMDVLDKEIEDVANRIIAVKYANFLLQDRLTEIQNLQQELDKNLSNVDKLYTNVAMQSQEFMKIVKEL